MSKATTPHFMPLTISTAPNSSKLILAEIRKSNGSIPNLMATLANNPAALEGYRTLEAVWENGSFAPRERQLIFFFAASAENQNLEGAGKSGTTGSYSFVGSRR